MIDAFYIFTKGGLLLWSTQLVKVKGDPLDSLIREVLLEERLGETVASLQSYSLKWKLINELELFFVAVYQRIVQITYLEGLLASAANEFLKHVTDGIGKTLDIKPPYRVDFDADFRKVLAKADKDALVAKRAPAMKTFEQTKKGAQVKKNQEEQGVKSSIPKKKSKGSKDGKENEEDDDEDDDEGTDDKADATAEARKKLLDKAKAKNGKKKDDKEKEEPTETDKKKKGKEARHWEGGKVTKTLMQELDFSKPRNEDDDRDLAAAKATYLDDEEDEAVPSEVSSIADEDEDSEPEEASDKVESKPGRVGGLFKTLTRSVKNLTGGAVLTNDDLDPILHNFKNSLMARNVAAEVSDKLADSVRTSVVGRKTDRFTSMAATVKHALKDAMENLLTPKKSIDVLRAALSAKNANRVYSIVFLGVNGVGKSTNLAKVAYYLKHKGDLNVMICACDTFRAGAVEQLKTHSRCLDVPLFERGYGKDPAEIAKSALAHAASTGMDVVLIDTAGRMQDNEPLMRALAKLVAINSPDLVLFVGEALVGNDAIDQVTKFNRSLIDMSHDPRNPRGIDGMLLTKYDTVDDKVGAALSMVYVTGQPIVFVGCGQKYTHLRKMQAKEVVKTLLG